MKAMPRVYSNFAEFERAELNRLNDLDDIDEMLDQMFADELDTDFGQKKGASAPQKTAMATAPQKKTPQRAPQRSKKGQGAKKAVPNALDLDE
jgi:hypothetical protein